MGQDAGVKELLRLCERNELKEADYERLAMAVFGKKLAEDAPKQKLWEQRSQGRITFGAYVYRRDQIEDDSAIRTCWKRLERDLYWNIKPATAGVQRAFAIAREQGLLNNPRWGGEYKREAEQILRRNGIDPLAAPGLHSRALTEGPPPKDPADDRAVIYPAVDNALLEALKIDEKLGIAHYWTSLPDSDRFLLNAMFGDMSGTKQIDFLEKLASSEIEKLYNNKDLQVPPWNWMDDLPGDVRAALRPAVEALPARSQDIVAARYAAYMSGREGGLLRDTIKDLWLGSRGRASGEELLNVIVNRVCSLRDSVGARFNYQMQVDRGRNSVRGYITHREKRLPQIAKQERQMATRHAEERHRQLVAEMQIIMADPGLKHIGERYAKLYEVYGRSNSQELLAAGRGFGKAAVGTVTGIVQLLTTDPRKTAAGLYQLARHPEMLIVALDDAMVDEDEFMGGLMFEMVMTAVGAGPATKASQGAKAARLANLAQDAAKAGRLRAAKRLSTAAEKHLHRARQAGEAVGEAEQAVSRARRALDDAPTTTARKADQPPGMSPHSAPSERPRSSGPMRENIAKRYRHVALGGFLVKGTKRIFIQGTAEQVRRIDVRIRQLQRFPEGKRLIKELDDALEKTAQADVDAAVQATAKRFGWTDERMLQSERTRLLRDNRRNRRVVIKWTGEKGRIQCDPPRRRAGPTRRHRPKTLRRHRLRHRLRPRPLGPHRLRRLPDPPPPPPPSPWATSSSTPSATPKAEPPRPEPSKSSKPSASHPSPDWINSPKPVTENTLRQGWATLQKQVAELRTDY